MKKIDAGNPSFEKNIARSRGTYLNPGAVLFAETLACPLYVDKTLMIRETNRVIGTKDKFMCVSRARRFGKSIALETLAAYYSKGADGRIFDGLAISGEPGFFKHLGKYNVIMIDLNSFYDNCGDDKLRMFDVMLKTLKSEFEQQLPEFSSNAESVPFLLRDAYAKTGEKFVVLIDEYDVLARKEVSDELFEKYLEFLNGMFKNIDVTQSIALAYITGILPVVREKFQSKLNNFTEYTMLSPRNLLSFTGFTSDEVEELCMEKGIDVDECRRWYDGYHIKGLDFYSPKSVYELIATGEFRSYWVQTGSFEAVSDYIGMDFDGMVEDVNRLIAGESIPVETHSYENRVEASAFKSKDDVFTYCIHLGYLSYDSGTGLARIPNYEVRLQWLAAVKSLDRFSETRKILRISRQLIENIIHGRDDMVAQSLEAAHREVTSSLSYNNEQSLQSAIMLSFIAARDSYTIIPEFPSGDGYADVVLVPYKPKRNEPAIVVELKVDSAVETGLDQIRRRKYPSSLKHYENNLVLVGVSYDRKTKKHSAIVEKIVRDK